MASARSLPVRFASSPENQASLAIYSRAIEQSDAAKIKGMVKDVIASSSTSTTNHSQSETAPPSDWRKEPGKAYYVNLKTGERRFELEEGDEEAEGVAAAATVAAVVGVAGAGAGAGGVSSCGNEIISAIPDAKAADFVSVADAYGHAARLARSEIRNESSTIELRRASNFVKDGPIRTAIAFWIHNLRRSSSRPAVNVLDLCCGRGQDFDKYRRAARDSDGSIDALVGVDVAGGEAAKSARDRWAQCAELQISSAELQSSFRSVMMGGTLVADLSRGHPGCIIPEAAKAAGWDTESYPEIGSFHVVSCMFAMHYFFKEEASFRNLVMGAGWYLREGGFLIMVHADGESIAAHYTKRGPSDTIRVGQATIRLHPHTRSMLDGEPFPDGRAFGWSYDFHLPQAVENVTEYLVHSPTRDRIMEEYHLIKVFDEAADVALLSMTTVPFWNEAFLKSEVDCNGSGRCSEETLDHLSLYRVVIYAKSPLKVDIHGVRNFIRSKMGYSK